MTNTIQIGNQFRDLVVSILAAAGFHADSEVRVNFKKVDSIATWLRDTMDGPCRYAIEAKDYGGTVDKDECIKFHTEYGQLIADKKVDRAWFVSRGPVSPDGRALIDSHRDMKCFTFESLQRHLLRIDGYLRDLLAEYDREQIEKFYVPPRTQDNEDLLGLIERWIDEPEPLPIAILGGYGRGKSTFAKHLSAALASKALADSTARAPILVPLGEVVDEQSVDGLIGKVLASKHRTGDYHFHLFSALNAAGRFVVIFDGFDEMKHGMTIHTFQRNIKELMKLDQGDSRILILGRDTAFHDEHEFRAVILGRQVTAAGQEVTTMGRRECRRVFMRDFSLDEAKAFVARYFPLRLKENNQQGNTPFTDTWKAQRLSELTDGRFDELIVRPVHAQMLCEIATNPLVSLARVSKFQLYDLFIHHLLEREVDKKGRHDAFSLSARRRFNSGVAWWLWEKGGASTTTLSDIPKALCADAGTGVDHDLDEIGLRRELTAGCLVEKSGETIYFGHRSIQEFLVAEWLYETDLVCKNSSGKAQLGRLLPIINAEIIDFLRGRVEAVPSAKSRVSNWFDLLDTWRHQEVPLQGFDLFVQLGRIVLKDTIVAMSNPWLVWLNFFMVNEAADHRIRNGRALQHLEVLMRMGMGGDREIQAATLMLMARVMQRTTKDRGQMFATLLAHWLPRDKLRAAIQEANRGKKATALVRRDECLPLWAFLVSSKIVRSTERIASITTDLSFLRSQMANVLNAGFATEIGDETEEEIDNSASCTTQSLYQALSRMDVSGDELDKCLRPFMNDIELRDRIKPLVVVVAGRLSPA